MLVEAVAVAQKINLFESLARFSDIHSLYCELFLARYSRFFLLRRQESSDLVI